MQDKVYCYPDSDVLKIKELRILAKISQSQLSKKYGIPINTIKSWECEASKPNHRNCPPYVAKMLERLIKEDYGV